MRYSTDLGTFCQPGLEGRLDHFWRLAKVQDVSATGIGLVLGIRFDPGTILTVELPEEGEDSRLIQARVIHARSEIAEGWVTGCAFVDRLTDNEVKALQALKGDPIGRLNL